MTGYAFTSLLIIKSDRKFMLLQLFYSCCKTLLCYAKVLILASFSYINIHNWKCGFIWREYCKRNQKCLACNILKMVLRGALEQPFWLNGFIKNRSVSYSKVLVLEKDSLDYKKREIILINT